MKPRITIAQNFKVVEADGERGPYKVQTTQYMYAVEDSEGREIFSYHWQPAGKSHLVEPHMHVGSGALCELPAVTAAHFRTGRICIEDFLLVLQESFGVEPTRPDWEQVLAESRQKFRDWRSWA
jgi:hypothetical protein